MKTLHVSNEIREAFIEQKPIVALESTIISHGLPYPDNKEVALRIHDIVREEGAVPATIAIIDGQLKVGLDEEDIERLATEEGVVKTSIRDLPGVLTKRQTGSTTVATTSYAASQAGIRFFATGGIGGVHRDFPNSMDVSNDLNTLAKSNICVVSAGIKSILDVPNTLEMFETLGVPVYGYETTRYPGFYTTDSGITVETISKEEAASLMRTKDHLTLDQSVHIAVPVPEEEAIDPDWMHSIILEALQEANNQHVTGKDITPFLLKTIHEKTNGQSVKANIALIKNNAKIAAQIANNYYNNY
ncbi:pseudouridine-5'-phosphate glycosidase [Pontibacillus yanchengensis]|uniref:Pseudouridine-5'-phosphate glycosidase n=1 Tax=Pontibacillus yanchengensis Y32 TaxID=1385514 RepID=A0A0A2TWP6_9BACI|nr:pseudouridine-5'-phosphate glycosidase [Pontibacillus yanchengensis]KGP73695.1 pseudouridine-5'-phosphate glycosidase [Pontibacillus yanchengensis Y32]